MSASRSASSRCIGQSHAMLLLALRVALVRINKACCEVYKMGKKKENDFP